MRCGVVLDGGGWCTHGYTMLWMSFCGSSRMGCLDVEIVAV